MPGSRRRFHADRNARHGRRICADRLCEERRRRILLFAVRGHCRRAVGVVDRRGTVCPGDRRHDPAEDDEAAWRRPCGTRPFHAAVPRCSRLLHARALAGDRRDDRAFRRLVIRIRLHPAAILPGLRPGGAGRRSQPAAGRVDLRDRARGRTVRGAAEGRPEHRPLQSSMSAKVRSASTCRSTCSSPTIISRRRSSSPRASRSAKSSGRGCKRRSTREFANLNTRIYPLELGPPVGWPLQYRVSGQTPEGTRDAAFLVAQTIGQNPNTRLINFDWNEPMKSLRVEVDQDRVRQLGVSSEIAGRGFQRRHQRHGRHPGPRLDLSDRSDGSGDRRSNARRCRRCGICKSRWTTGRRSR